MSKEENKLVARWYFGGISSAFASLVTHPLGLIKVHCQTSVKKRRLIQRVTKVYRLVGISGMYSGISASLLRQCTYSMARFGIYGQLKIVLDPTGGKEFTFLEMMGMAAVSGLIGGIIGCPIDMVKVRMQNDVKLAPDQRRNYKHAFDGLYRVYTEEGATRLFSGLTFASIRAVGITVGQLSVYDEVKRLLMNSGYFADNILLHFTTGFTAGGVATILTHPVDVLKTRQMNSKPGEFRGNWHLILHSAKMGPSSFLQGIVPAYIRLTRHTAIQFVIWEQLRLKFGYNLSMQ